MLFEYQTLLQDVAHFVSASVCSNKYDANLYRIYSVENFNACIELRFHSWIAGGVDVMLLHFSCNVFLLLRFNPDWVIFCVQILLRVLQCFEWSKKCCCHELTDEKTCETLSVTVLAGTEQASNPFVLNQYFKSKPRTLNRERTYEFARDIRAWWAETHGLTLNTRMDK